MKWKKLKSREDIEALLLNNNKHSDHVNAVENDLVSVGNLENIDPVEEPAIYD